MPDKPRAFLDAPALAVPSAADLKRYNAEHPDRPILAITIELGDIKKELTVFNTPLLLRDLAAHEGLMVALSQNITDILHGYFNKGEKK